MTSTSKNSKKYFLIWADNGPEINQLIDTLAERGHELVYWVGLKENTSRFQDLLFQDHYAAWAGTPAQALAGVHFSPAAKELIEKMYSTEALVLTMMNKRFDKLLTDERKHLYYSMLAYWDGVIKRYQPELIIFPTIPHTVYNYIIYDLAKMYGIKTVMFEDSWVSDRLLLYRDWRQGSELLAERLQANAGKTFQREDLAADLIAYFDKQTNPEADATPVYMTHWKNKFSGWNQFKAKLGKAWTGLKDGSFFSKLFRYLKRSRIMDLRKELESVMTKPDWAKNYVYVPLSFQPERTTSPQGDMFVDQILMVETLAAGLPAGWKIYVKEHPSQWWLRSGTQYSSVRYLGFYRQLAGIKNVQLVPITTDTYTLMEKARAVATVTGTAGWESILRNKPVMIFGYPWYRDFPGLFRLRNVDDDRMALEKISSGYTTNSQQVINFLKSFDEATIHGYVEGFVEHNSKLSKAESMLNIINFIVQQIL